MQHPLSTDPVPGRSFSPENPVHELPILEGSVGAPAGLAALTLVADTLERALGLKDRVTGGHIKRTAHYAAKLASQVDGVSESTIERVRLAAILHDVGKIGIEDSILKKSAALDDEERARMRAHPELGAGILDRMEPGSKAGIGGEFAEALAEIRGGILHHHERWDGQGYPHRLAGEQIPWIARVVAIVDAYDAMVSTRPYRKGMSPRLAYAEILKLGGTQFDPQLVAVFARVFA